MDREGVSASLHDRVVGAVERAVRVHDESYALIERQLAVATELHETLDVVERRRIAVREARKGRRAFGNGHRHAQGRSRPG
jgi:hypothetical protein